MDVAIDKIAEVIQANSTEFIAQCYKLGQSPELGALVKVIDENVSIYGIVYSIETRSIDPGRRIIARGAAVNSKDDVFQYNPQLAKLLITEIKALVLGYGVGDDWRYYLPPNPVPIHGFVYICQREEIQKFEKSMGYLDLIINTKLNYSVDEIIAAHLRYASRVFTERSDFLVRAGKELAKLLSNDSIRLNYILKRLA